MPHIFATSSTDSTLRIWNIHGAPAPDIPQRVKSENFPMADADEGTECVAVIAGHGYGHRERAIDCVSEVSFFFSLLTLGMASET